MSIKVSETLLSQLYNKKVKETYLEKALEDDVTRESYCVYLIQAANWEKNIGKDLYSFSREDVLDLCSDNFTSSPTSLRIFYSVCKQYVSWAIEQGYNETMINSFDLVKFKQHILPMLNLKGLENKYITEEDLWKIVDGYNKIINGEEKEIGGAKNYQDSICLILPFYGIKGSKNIELVNLKRNDINTVTNKVTLATEINEDTGEIISTRIVELPKKVIDLMLKAWGEDIYIKSGDKNTMKKDYVELIKSDYVLKPSAIGKRENDDKIRPQTVASRAKKLLVSAGYNISINDVYTSGKLEALKKLEKENGKLEIEDFKTTQEKFGDSVTNYSNLKELWNQLAISKAD